MVAYIAEWLVSNTYRIMVEGIPEFDEVAADVNYVLRPGGYLIVRNLRGEIAIVSTPQGIFLPGGGQEQGEPPAQAAVREAIEECGLRVWLTGLLGTADELVYAASEGKHYRKRCAFFSAEVDRVDGRGEDDHRLMWMEAQEAVSRLRHGSQAWAVTEASRLTNASLSRQVEGGGSVEAHLVEMS